jgi:DNA mismatch repair protein MutL
LNAIAVLPREIVDQIAAGDVVQRPASAVKELLENCLGAGSTHVIIKVEEGDLAKS